MIGIAAFGGIIGTPTSTRVVYGDLNDPQNRVRINGTGLTVDGNGVVNGGTVTSIQLFDHSVSPPVLVLDVRYTGGGFPGSTIAANVNSVLPLAAELSTWANYPYGDGFYVSVTATQALFQHSNGTFTLFEGSGFVEGTVAVGTIDTITHLDTDGTTVLNSVTGLAMPSLAVSALYGNSFALYESLSGGTSNVTAYGESSTLFLEAGLGNDRITGSTDVLEHHARSVGYFDAVAAVVVDLDIGTGQGRATGGAGVDTLINIDHVYGSAFDDRIIGNGSDNYLLGYFGNDELRGEGGRDALEGAAGNDRLYGGDGDDFLLGGDGDDYLNGGTGNDFVSYFFADGPITVDLRLNNLAQNTGEGTDTLVGIENFEGSDFVDSVFGSNVGNLLDGGQGNDTIRALGGNDDIYGGDGLDILVGGTGQDDFIFRLDFFLFTTFEEGRDRITDFVVGQDKVVLTDQFQYLNNGTTLLAGNFYTVGTGTQDADDFLVFDPTTARLYWDTNGNGAGGRDLLAQFNTGQTITSADILVDFVV